MTATRYQPPGDTSHDRQGREDRNLAVDVLRSLGLLVRGQLVIAAIMTGLYAIA